MSSPIKDTEEPSSSHDEGAGSSSGAGGEGDADAACQRPPAKRHITPVIEISDTESDDSDVCAVNSYQASADEVKRIRRGYIAFNVYYKPLSLVCAGISYCLKSAIRPLFRNFMLTS